MPPRPLFDFGACSCPLPQGLDRLGRYAASLGDQAGFPALPSLRSVRSEEHTSELQSLMRISYAVFCLKKKKIQTTKQLSTTTPQTYYISNSVNQREYHCSSTRQTHSRNYIL